MSTLHSPQIRRWLAAFLLTASLCLAQLEKFAGDAQEVEISADKMTMPSNGGIVVLSGNASLRYGDISCKAREVTLNRDTMDITAQGDVLLQVQDVRWTAPAIKGNLNTQAFSFGPFRLDGEVWHGGGDGGEHLQDGRNALQGAWLSTCDKYDPHYCISAKEIRHRPDNTFTAKHVCFRIWNVPVFYLPYMWGSTNNNAGIILKPGYSGRKGAFLTIGRLWKHDDGTESQLYTDLMSKRGIGLGLDTQLKTLRGESQLKLYGVFDQDAPETEKGYNRRFKFEDDRYRLKWSHLADLTDDLSLRANIDVLSDIDMLEDWFRSEHRHGEVADTTLSLTYEQPAYSAGISLRPRLNDFQTTVERLPELHFTTPRLRTGSLPFLYQQNTTAGYYSVKWRDFDRKRVDLLDWDIYDEELHGDNDDYSSFRADTLHFLYLPMDFWDRLTLTPRAGARVTYYSRSSRLGLSSQDLANNLEVDNPDRPYAPNPVVNYDRDGGELTRTAYELGVELKTDFASEWQDFKMPLFDVDGIKHVVEPYINYTWATKPTEDREHIYFFDEIDRLTKQHFIRFGVDQHWLTRRNGQTETVTRLQSYVDIHGDDGEESESHEGDLGNRLDFSPRKDLHFWAALLHDMGEQHIQRGEAGFRIGKEEELNISLKYLYRNNHLSRSTWSMGSSLVDLTGESSYIKKYFETADIISARLFLPLNAITSLTIHAEYDLEKCQLSEHFYELNRTLHCWQTGVGFGWDNDDFKILLLMRCVAFPKIKIDLNI